MAAAQLPGERSASAVIPPETHTQRPHLDRPVVTVTDGGSAKEGEVSFSTGIDKRLRADLVISIVIVEGDGGDVIAIACGGEEHCAQRDMNAPTLAELV
jgi:hypothetical protein